MFSVDESPSSLPFSIIFACYERSLELEMLY